MRKTDLLLGALVASMSLGVTVSLAQGRHDRDPAAMFESLDADGDGQITAAEFDAAREARFAAFDTDGDGQISKDEFVAQSRSRSAERAERIFGRLDADGDGVLSRDAFEGRRDRGPDAGMISRLDGDGDGAVSREEFDAGIERFAGKRGRHGGGFGKKSQ